MTTDVFWDRLMAGHRALVSAGPSHPDLRAGDPALVARLTVPEASEDRYTAPEVHTREVDVVHPSGTCSVRVYTPLGPRETHRPLFVWVHGGGWAAGDLDGPEADATSREVCAAADAIVVSVDYRLATHGVHYPIPLDDVLASYLWAVNNARELGADPSTTTLGGASAGGNLAAGAALRLRDGGGPLPSSLVLVYPCLHPVLPPPSEELGSKLALLDASMAAAPHLLQPVVENYLGASVTEADGYAMPGVAPDLTDLPPTLILNAEYDGLRCSGEAFATQLDDAGVSVVVATVPDVAHGHLARPGMAAARRTNMDLAAWVAGARSR